jgi:choline dehydrogenase-like flavoprotein
MFGHTATLVCLTDDLPEEQNRVTLDPVLTDSNGIPAPKVSYTLSDNTRKILAFAAERGEQVMRAAGAHDVIIDPQMRNAGWHLMGTARMGRDPRTSVVNEWGRAHDVKNLFVIDGSLFVTGAAVNPTSTIQALALHVAANVKKNLESLFD